MSATITARAGNRMARQGGATEGGSSRAVATRFAPAANRPAGTSPSGGTRSARASKTAAAPSAMRLAASKPAVAGTSRSRRVAVFGGLVGVMTVTGALLVALRPAPLSAEAGRALMAVDGSASPQADTLFDTRVPVRTGRWRYVYVHHAGQPGVRSDGSGRAEADASASADHFVIGSGDGAEDGAIQIGSRWEAQQPAGRPTGLDRVDPDCVSIRVAGDLDRSSPSPRQMEQLNRLVAALQDRLKVNRGRVWVVEAPNSPAGCGRYFPRDAFRDALLP
ncbi:MAG: N-acetylmuramoyl-L-alanine amidase [Phycisphaerales bacterium]|nr:N-acetylmuramoyl-L-alanine amidase [Phycisphaerales bacterium]